MAVKAWAWLSKHWRWEHQCGFRIGVFAALGVTATWFYRAPMVALVCGLIAGMSIGEFFWRSAWDQSNKHFDALLEQLKESFRREEGGLAREKWWMAQALRRTTECQGDPFDVGYPPRPRKNTPVS